MREETAKERALTSCPIDGCRNYRYANHYMCAAHWRRLPAATKRELRLRDGQAMTRLRLLWEAIDAGIPLGKIFITASAGDGTPVLVRGQAK